MRPPAVLKVSLTNAYPRCYATRRISASGFYFGPFQSRRAADTFASGFLDLFKIRRCQIKIRRDPDFPGCIYSEMKMCLAPCFAGCTQEEYDAEVGRVVAFLATGGASLTAELEREREAASEALDFERAAAVHRRIEKAAEALRGLPDLARRLEDLNAVVLQRAAEENTVAVFVVRAGRIEEPRLLRFAELAGEPRSVEQILREWLEGAAEQRFPSRQIGCVPTKLSRTGRSAQPAGALVSQEAAPRRNIFPRSDGTLLRCRRAARRSQRAPQQRVALSPHSARVLANPGAASGGDCSRQLKLRVKRMRARSDSQFSIPMLLFSETGNFSYSIGQSR